MILIGQYDSPFVRRVGIALVQSGIAFEHRPWSVFRDSEKIAPLNPLVRVPTLVLDSGETLVESSAMLDYVDGQTPSQSRMAPSTEPERYRALRVTGLAMGMAEKAVSLFYENVLHTEISKMWAERCEKQILGALAALEAELAQKTSDFWFGDRLMHADVAVAVAFRFLSEAHPAIVDQSAAPGMMTFCRRLEEMMVFKQISQAFIPPA